MTITPFILGRGMAGQAFQKSLAILSLQHPDWGIQETLPLSRNQKPDITLKTPNPILFIANPHGLHAQSILEGEKAGFKAMVVEKPACVNLKEIESLKVVRIPVAVCHGYHQMWGPQTLKQMLDAGEFGELISIEGHYWQSSAAQKALEPTPKPHPWKNDPALSGGSDALIDIGIHWVETAAFLMGEPGFKGRAWLSYANAEAPHRDTHVHLNLQFSGGRRAMASVSKTFQEKELELKRFQAIVNTSDDAIISKSLSGVIESWNLGAEHMFGYAAPEAIGKHISLLIPAERLHEEQGIMQRVLRKETVSHYETLRLHKQGRLIDVSVSISPIMDENGEVVAITKIARDITERKAYQQAREQAEQAKLEAAMSSMHDAMFMTDAQGNFLNFNDAFVKFLRFNSKEECPKTFAEYPAILEVHLQDWEPFTEDPWLVSRALRGEVGSNVELYLLRKDTGERWVGSYSYAPIRNQQGEILGAVITARDITELKQIQLDLQESQLAANAANQAKSSFLANMSHEIRTPMNAVLGLCYLLAKRPLDEDSHSLVSKIESASQSLLAIINDILDFSKIEAGRLEIANAPFKLSEMLDHLAVLMSSAAGSKRLELIITPAEVDAVIGDSMRLQQVLVNLLSNAIKFTEHGEVELRIRVAEQQGEQALLLFSVRDTGIGISDQQLQNIFTAFAQADNTISRRFGGSGLGLTISAQLVRLMGGELQVKSSVGVGSEFRFVLPLNFDRNAEVSKSNLVDLQLLVVDDSSAARDALTLTVQHLGWQADEAASGLAAIEQIQHKADQHNLYDVLLLDWKMPGMDGLATAQYIRETLSEKSPRLHRPPIVLMVTAFDSSALQHTPGMHHVDGVLNKPVTPSILYNAIVKVLYRRSGSVAVSTLLAAQAQQRIPGIRVLLVDDSEINREVAQHILEGDGAVVSLASNGQEALDWLCAHQGAVDIVLMDMQMPVMDGLTATREIRRNPAWASLPVLALTAGVFQDSKYAAQAAGLNDFIAKPFKVERLVALIQQWTKSKGSSKGVRVD